MKKINLPQAVEIDEAVLMIKNELNIEESKIVVKKITIDNLEDAEEYLNDISTDESKVYAVRTVESIGDFNSSEIAAELKADQAGFELMINGYPGQTIERFQEQTSAKRTCKNCKSSISKDFLLIKITKEVSERENNIATLEDIKCPICGDSDFLTSTTEEKKLKGWKAKKENIDAKLMVAKSKFDANPENVRNILLVNIREVEVENEISTPLNIEE